jgi:hypothetical protein
MSSFGTTTSMDITGHDPVRYSTGDNNNFEVCCFILICDINIFI